MYHLHPLIGLAAAFLALSSLPRDGLADKIEPQVLLQEAQVPTLHPCDAAERHSQILALPISSLSKVGISPKEVAHRAATLWGRCVDQAGRRDHKQERQKIAAVPHAKQKLDERQEKLLQALSLFLRSDPQLPPADDKTRGEFLYRRARVYYTHNHLAEAAAGFREVLASTPRHEVAPYAADQLLDTLVLLSQQEKSRSQEYLEEINTVVDKLQMDPFYLADQERATRLRKIRHALEQQRLERLAKAEAFEEAGIGYLELAKRDPDESRVDELLYNGSVFLFRAGRVELSYLALEQLVTKYPASSLGARSRFRMAEMATVLTEFERAAAHYEDFARKHPAISGEFGSASPPAAVEALQRACFLRSELSQVGLARANLDRISKLAGLIKPSAGQEVQRMVSACVLKMAALYGEVGASAERKNLLEGYLRSPLVDRSFNEIARKLLEDSALGRSNTTPKPPKLDPKGKSTDPVHLSPPALLRADIL